MLVTRFVEIFHSPVNSKHLENFLVLETIHQFSLQKNPGFEAQSGKLKMAFLYHDLFQKWNLEIVFLTYDMFYLFRLLPILGLLASGFPTTREGARDRLIVQIDYFVLFLTKWNVFNFRSWNCLLFDCFPARKARSSFGWRSLHFWHLAINVAILCFIWFEDIWRLIDILLEIRSFQIEHNSWNLKFEVPENKIRYHNSPCYLLVAGRRRNCWKSPKWVTKLKIILMSIWYQKWFTKKTG